MIQLTLSETEAAPRLVNGSCARCGETRDGANGTACEPCLSAIVHRDIVDAINGSPATIKQYALAYRGFVRFATEQRNDLDYNANWVAAYLRFRLQTGITPRTVAHDYACLRAIGGHRGYPVVVSTELRDLLRSLSKKRHETPLSHARPLRIDDLTAIVKRETRYSRLQYHRDTAVILLGWSIGARPQDIAALRWRNLRITGGVLVVSVPAGKTASRTAHVLPARDADRCPVAAVRRWSVCCGVDLDETEGIDWVFCPRIDRWGNYRRSVAVSSEAVSDLVRAACEAAGLGPGYAGGSLRSGFVTSAAAAGIDDRDIMAVTGHRSLAALSRYRRDLAAFANPALKLL